jgi:HEAT repeat protein
MPLKKRHLHKIDWFFYREERDKKLHHYAEHDGFAEMRKEPDGSQSVNLFVEMLCDKNEKVRIAAAGGHEQFDELLVIEALVKKAQDCDLSVRWAATNILIQIGRKGLRPLLEALTHDYNSFCLRQSARHILQTLHERGDLTNPEVEVLRALEKRRPVTQIASVANDALIASL